MNEPIPETPTPSPANSWRASFERSFENWGRKVVAHPWLLVVVSLLVTGALGSFLPRISFDASIDQMLPAGDPTLQRYQAFHAQYGSDEVGVVAIEPPEIFDRAFLEKLRAFHDEVEEQIPRVTKVTSLLNARATYGRGDELVVEDLIETLPESKEQMAALRERAMGTPAYRNLLLSADGKITTVMIELEPFEINESTALDTASFDGDAFGEEEFDPEEVGLREITMQEFAESSRALRAIMARYEGPDFPMHSTGTWMVNTALIEWSEHSMPRMTGATIALCAVLLTLLFRHIWPVVLALGVVVLSVISSLGLIASSGVAFTPPMQPLPTFLLAVGVGYSVHLLTIFFQRFDAGASKDEALIQALGHSGLPILMTGLTTIVAMLGFASAELTPIMHFGVGAAGGVLVTLLYTLVTLPAMLVIVPVRRRAPRPEGEGEDRISRSLATCGHLATRHPHAIVITATVLVLLAAVVASQARFSMLQLHWLPKDDPQRIGAHYIDTRMGGGNTLEVLIDTGVENGLHEPEVLRRMDALTSQINAWRDEGMALGRTLSLVDIAKEIHQALNSNDPAFFAIADSRELLAQELLLFENSGSEDLEQFVDSEFRRARFSMRMPIADAVERKVFVNEARGVFAEIMGDAGTITFTGNEDITIRTLAATVSSTGRSYLIALALITPLMMLLIGSLRSGLVSMAPNLSPILITVAAMQLMGIPFDVFTLQVGCIALGLAVDDTIHFIHGFRRVYLATGDPERAVQETLRSTGRALFYSSLVLTTGFAVFVLSPMQNLTNFGLITSFAIIMAFLFDVLVTPALLLIVTKRR